MFIPLNSSTDVEKFSRQAREAFNRRLPHPFYRNNTVQDCTIAFSCRTQFLQRAIRVGITATLGQFHLTAHGAVNSSTAVKT